jgi:hypothetical protein
MKSVTFGGRDLKELQMQIFETLQNVHPSVTPLISTH